MITIAAALAVVLGAAPLIAQSDPVVTVPGGQIRGASLEGGGAVFKGIPYAEPPIGDLRWREPMPVKTGWQGVRSATEFGPACAQRPSPIPNAAALSNEDCLLVNVWTAEWPSRSPKAVMVWIPGGGNFAGSSSEVQFDSHSLARRGIVLVSINYRLGPFGFFSHPALTRESGGRAAANQGILDQIAALEWVRDNIGRFGGDPQNVTIFGSSAGGLNVGVLLTSPLSNGLFHRAIAQSGPVVLEGDPLFLAEAEERGKARAARWKLPPTASLSEFRALSTTQILETEPDLMSQNGLNIALEENPPNLGITVDGYVFETRPADVFASGQQHRVPLIIGSNAREGVRPPPTDLVGAIADTYGPLAERAHSLYTTADPVYGPPASQWLTDTSFRCASVLQSVWHARANNPAFLYEFARAASGREALGTTHAAEISHVFGTLERGVYGMGPAAEATETDVRISDLIQRYWTNFAKTGDPNDATLPEWRPFDPAAWTYVELADAGASAKDGLRRAQCELFIEHITRTLGK